VLSSFIVLIMNRVIVTKMDESLSLLCKLNENLCNQVEIFDAISASQDKSRFKPPKGSAEVAKLRCDLEERDKRFRVNSAVEPDSAHVQTSSKAMEGAFTGLSFP